MLGTLPTPILLDIAIFFTALCWGLGFFIADRKSTCSRHWPSGVLCAFSGTA
jgi:hypothetical protein